MSDRAALVAYARDSIARGSKSFAAASKLFDRTTRERVWLLYAWCRKCDDMADGQDHGGTLSAVADPQAAADSDEHEWDWNLHDARHRPFRGDP